MKLILLKPHKGWGWFMWGLLGKHNRWFLGFSKAVPYEAISLEMTKEMK